MKNTRIKSLVASALALNLLFSATMPSVLAETTNVSEFTGYIEGENAFTGETYSYQTGTVLNVNSSANIRSAASTSSSTLGSVLKYGTVEIIGEEGSFYKINFKDSVGYVSKSLIEVDNANTEILKVVNVTSSANVRSGAGTSYSTIGQVRKGEKVQVVAQFGSWVKIYIGNGEYGYVSKSLLEKPVVATGRVVNVNSAANVRRGPSKNNPVIATIPKGDKVEVVGETIYYYEIRVSGYDSGYISKSLVEFGPSIEVEYVDYDMTLNEFIDKQYERGTAVISSNGQWAKASRDDIAYYATPENFLNQDNIYMFMQLNYIDGFTTEIVNNALSGKGILDGKAQSVLNGAMKHDVHPAYVLSHMLLETGNGTSALANGILVEEVDGKPVEPKVTYNMFGIGAIDADANKYGAERAYKEGWFTPEKAIEDGIYWISEGYINNPTYNQNTLYSMRWNPDVIWHQYATDVAWASKQMIRIQEYMDLLENPSFTIRIPRYKDELNVKTSNSTYEEELTTQIKEWLSK